MEIRLIIDDDFINSLKKRLKIKSTSVVILEGLGLVDWASTEMAANRAILSMGENGEKPVRIETVALRRVRKK